MRLIRQNIEVQQHEIALHNKSLSQLLRADFMMNRNGKLKLILNRQDLVKANRMVKYYDYLRKQRLKKMAVIQNSVVELVKLEKQQKKDKAGIIFDGAISAATPASIMAPAFEPQSTFDYEDKKKAVEDAFLV